MSDNLDRPQVQDQERIKALIEKKIKEGKPKKLAMSEAIEEVRGNKGGKVGV